MLKKPVEHRSSLSDVLRSPVLFSYIRQLRKERDAELSANCSKARRLGGLLEEPILKTAHSAEEVLEGDRITLWNPLDDVEDSKEEANLPWRQLSLSLSVELSNPFEVCEEAPSSPASLLRSTCISSLGEELFSSVHVFLKTQRERSVDDDLVVFI